MKKYALSIISFYLVVLSTKCIAQDSLWKAVVRGQSEKGQWVVARHKQFPEKQLVSFYTRDNRVMYTEEVSTLRFNINKPKTAKKLEQLLATIALEWEQSKAIVRQQLVTETFN